MDEFELNSNQRRLIHARNSSIYRKLLKKIEDSFEEENEEFDGDDLALMVEDQAEKPDFPYMVFIFAIIKDCLDVMANLTIIGILFVWPLSIIFALGLFMWVFGRMGGGWWKKRIIRWVWNRYMLTIVIEFIPFLQMIPANTIFILMVHNKETKIVKLMNEALEQIHNLKIIR